MKNKRRKTDNRHMAIHPHQQEGNILVPFHKRAIMPMKPCPDCKSVGILTLNGNLFGCTRCSHDFR